MENKKYIPLVDVNQKSDGLPIKNKKELKELEEKDNKDNSNKVIVIIELIIFFIFLLVIIIFLRNKEYEPPLISYEEAEKIVDPERTKRNHNLLNKTLNNINELLENISNINFP